MRAIHLALTDDVRAQLRFLCAVYGPSPAEPRTAGQIVSDLIEGAFLTAYAKVKATHDKLQTRETP